MANRFTLERPLPFATEAFWNKVGQLLGAKRVMTGVGVSRDFAQKRYSYVNFWATVTGKNTVVTFSHAHGHVLGEVPQRVPPKGRDNEGQLTVEPNRYNVKMDSRTKAMTPHAMVREIHALVAKARKVRSVGKTTHKDYREKRMDVVVAATKEANRMSPAQIRSKLKRLGIRHLNVRSRDWVHGGYSSSRLALSKVRDDDLHDAYVQWKVSQVMGESTMSHLSLLLEALRGSSLAEARRKTFKQGKQALWDYLVRERWDMSNPKLKVPYATSPDGRLRLWFKPQAIWYEKGGRGSRWSIGAASSLHADVREESPEQIVAQAEKWASRPMNW